MTQRMYVYTGNECGWPDTECCRLSFLFFQGLLVETLSSLGLGMRTGRGFLGPGKQKRRGRKVAVPSPARKVNRAANGDRVRPAAGMTTSWQEQHNETERR